MSTERKLNNLHGKGFDVHGVLLGTRSIYNTIGHARPKWPALLRTDFGPGFSCFRQLSRELQNLVWEETFSPPRVFDDNTLRILNPQNDTIYSYLTPYALYVCRDSRAFAQSRLSHTFLFRGWPTGLGRTIYFDSNCDICVYCFTSLSWRTDFIPGQCLFSRVEIRANISPDKLASAVGCGLQGTLFSEKFPKLKYLTVRDRDVNLMNVVLRNGWTEDCWEQEAKLKKSTWEADWKLVVDFFGVRGIKIIILQRLPEAEERKMKFLASFPAHKIWGWER